MGKDNILVFWKEFIQSRIEDYGCILDQILQAINGYVHSQTRVLDTNL